MDKKSILTVVVAIIAVALIAGGVYALTNNNGGSDEPQVEYPHTIYYNVIDEQGIATDMGAVTFTTDSDDLEAFLAAANKAFSDVGLDLVMELNDKKTFVKLTYGDGGSNCSYYLSEGVWHTVAKTLVDYKDNETIALFLGNGYISKEVYGTLGEVAKSCYAPDEYAMAGYEYIRAPLFSYTISYDIIDDKGFVSKSDSVSFTTDMLTNEVFVAGANDAFKAKGVDAVFSIGDYITLKYNGNGNNATYYFDFSENKWDMVNSTMTQYVFSTSLLFMLDGYVSKDTYDAFDEAAKEEFLDMGHGYYAKAAPIMHSIIYEVIGDDGKVTSHATVTFTSGISLASYVLNANLALAGTGIVFDDGGWITFNGGSNNATYYEDDGWKTVQTPASDYSAHADVALMVGNGYISEAIYTALSEDEKAGWQYVGYDYGYDYIKLVDTF